MLPLVLFPSSTYSYILYAITFAVSCTLISSLSKQRRRNPKSLPSPPGPKGYPIIGNMLDMPKLDEKPWLVYDKMRDVYGEQLFYRMIIRMCIPV